MPVRQVPAVWHALTGVQLTHGALTPAARPRVQGPRGDVAEGLRAAVPQAPVVHTDETGWRVGGAPASLMAFETAGATVSPRRPHHRHEAVPEVIPAADDGVLVTDRGRSSEAQAFDGVPQQTCLAPSQRSISDVLETTTGRTRDFGARLKALLQDAIALGHEDHDGHVTALKPYAAALQTDITSQRRDRRLKDADHQRLLNALGWHHDRGNLQRLLTDRRGEPTHNRAERVLRPAVMARQVSQGSQNSRGASAFAAFSRVIRTRMNTQAGSVVEALSHVLRPPQP
jgi:transposase